MEQETSNTPPRAIWAYGYAFAPPIARDRLGPMAALLDAGQSEAKLASETWEGRFVNGDQITHILVVSDSPDQERPVNRRLEAELNRLRAGYSITAPLAVVGGTGS